MKTCTIEFTEREVELLEELFPVCKESAAIVEEYTGMTEEEFKNLYCKLLSARLDRVYGDKLSALVTL